MVASTPADRSMVASIGGLTLSAQQSLIERRARGYASVRARMVTYLARVDAETPGLDDAERTRRAELLRRADMQRLALKSAASRRKGRQLIADADAADRALTALGGVTPTRALVVRSARGVGSPR